MRKGEFHSPRGLAQVAVALLCALVLVTAVRLVLELPFVATFELVAGTHGQSSPALPMAWPGLEPSVSSPSGAAAYAVAVYHRPPVSNALLILQAVALAFSLAAFIAWFHRLYANLAAFVTRPLSCSPNRVVASFFVPWRNFVRPHEMMCEAWTHNAPRKEAWSMGFIHSWWLCVIACGVVFAVSLLLDVFSVDGTFGKMLWLMRVDLLGALLCTSAALLTIRVVRRQTSRQIDRAGAGEP